ncbi:hypothetical protein STCU_05707 [Strigomonas culicis]|uniref:Right handed beta helix domain-containing protein n=1 Tax=Strigomonas culicis TaxID=28005 RepID=S9VVS5_9TRYP|nr:hypothetical protein STCU_05707 [Strigomonas culicis]|eukprot:EPY27525.1 hypothetical protein STCU_05707 [Strigomonas culicis]
MPPPLEPLGPAAAAGKGAKPKKGKKNKITPEEQAELDRQRAEQEAELLQKTEEAIAMAQKQEEYLMTFAHPSRWASVEVTNVTFDGPVVVRRAHVTFRNCCFAAAAPQEAQLTVTQYCQVVCHKCTFEAPAHSGLYVLPTATVRTSQCLFTGVSQESLADSLRAGEAAPQGQDGDFLLTPELAARAADAKAARPAAVGVYHDGGAVLAVEGCRFIALGTGMLVRTHSRQEAVEAVGAASVTLRSNVFHHIFNTAITLDKNTRGATLAQNRVSDCGYYGLDCHAGSTDVRVDKNIFSVGALVRIRQGADVRMLNNQFHSVPIDETKVANPNYEPKY